MGKVFLIRGNAGQGKSAIVRNLAFALRSFGYSVLVVDGDIKTPRLGHYFGMPLVQNTIEDVLLGRKKLFECIVFHRSGMHLLLSTLSELDVPHPSLILHEVAGLADVVLVNASNDDGWPIECESIFVTHGDFPSIIEARQKIRKQCVKRVVVNQYRGDDSELSLPNIADFTACSVLGSVPEESLMRGALKQGHSLLELYPDSESSVAFKRIAANLMNIEYHSSVRSVPILAKFGLFP